MSLGGEQAFSSPGEALEHFGVKGMHWGVRKERAAGLQDLTKGHPITQKTKNGDQLTLVPNSPTKINKTLALLSQSYADNYAQGASLTIRDKEGKKVGDANFWYDKKDRDSVYLNWITINKHARGNGYASAVLKAAEDHSRKAGKKQMKLEVPGNAPDARHIYERMGFIATHEPTAKEAKNDPVWGGLTHMEKKLT
jgi:RimJ/RimL family protein N-acetyltransferase